MLENVSKNKLNPIEEFYIKAKHKEIKTEVLLEKNLTFLILSLGL